MACRLCLLLNVTNLADMPCWVHRNITCVPTHCVCFQESHVTFIPLQVKSPGPVRLDEFTLCEPHRLLAHPRRVWTVWQIHESQLGQRAQEPVGRRMTPQEDESPVFDNSSPNSFINELCDLGQMSSSL